MRQQKGKPLYSRGQWAVQRERCQIDESRVPREEKRSESLHDLLPAVMRTIGLEQEHWISRIETCWTEIAGADVAKHTRPGRYQRGVLTVFVDSSVWLAELSRFGAAPLRARLQSGFGNAIKELRFQLDPD